MSNPTGINQYTKGGKGKSKGLLTKSGKRIDSSFLDKIPTVKKFVPMSKPVAPRELARSKK